MTPSEAEKIIEEFHNSITDLRPGEIVQSTDELPCTRARIKHAHFVYGEYIIKNASLTEKNTRS